jgi:hypothetical protein
MTAAIPCIVKNQVALTSWYPAAPRLLFACKAKGATALVNRTMYIGFPTTN